MADLTTNCPHCNASKASIRIAFAEAIHSEHVGRGYASRYKIKGWLAGRCGSCNRPVTASFSYSGDEIENDLLNSIIKKIGPIEKICNIENIWPSPKEPEIPSSLDDIVERAFLQAEKTFLQKEMEESSAAMYRRAIEMTFKNKYPNIKGNNFDRINELVSMGILTKDMGDWAHEVRLGGNNAMHDLDGVNREELEALRKFTNAFLQYVYTLPEMVRTNRANRENS